MLEQGGDPLGRERRRRKASAYERVGNALEIVLAHITIASIPVHASDTLVGGLLARIIIFRSALSGRIPNGQYAPGGVDLVPGGLRLEGGFLFVPVDSLVSGLA